jgi:hypothetical protein
MNSIAPDLEPLFNRILLPQDALQRWPADSLRLGILLPSIDRVLGRLDIAARSFSKSQPDCRDDRPLWLSERRFQQILPAALVQILQIGFSDCE